MELKVLIDNNTLINNYYVGEPAVCFYIEDEGKSILFDTGYSDAFVRNANAMGINLSNIDTVVLSHGHNDHTGGLQFFPIIKCKKIKIVSHPNVFEKKRSGEELISSPLGKSNVEKNFDLQLTHKPVQLTNNIIYLGEIERTTDFENKTAKSERFNNGKWEPDYFLDDSAIVYKSNDGLYIITGCSHSGICNIIEYAKKVCKDSRINAVIGGFHLFNKSEQAIKTIEYFKKANVKCLYPCHCTSFEIKALINKDIEVTEVGVGLTLEWQ